MRLLVTRMLVAAVVCGGFGLTVLAGGGEKPHAVPSPPAELPMIPVVPTIPAPVPPTSQHVRFAQLVPVQGKDGKDGKEGNGEKKVELPTYAEAGPELSLGECISVAVGRHPSIKAAKLSLQSNEQGYQSLLKFGTVGTLISPDLDIRKQQAQRGLAAAAAEYQKAHNEVVQDVTRMYYTAVYAKQQQAVADDLVGKLNNLVEIIDNILKNADDPKTLEGLNRGKLLLAQIGTYEAQGKQAEARIGRQRALAALRQAMAVEESSFPFQVKDKELPVMDQQQPINKELVVDLAVCRRPELAMAAAGVDAFRLEVYAQGKIPFKRVVPTLASGTDLHSKEIPQAMRGKDYRPGAIAPEMPPQLVGSKFDRVCRAMTYSQRAETVYDSARSLVTLEAENTFFEFQLAGKKLQLAKLQYDKALELQQYFKDTAQDIKAKDVIVQGMVITAKVQSDYVTAVYEYLLALSALERVTAGGIKPSFPGR